MTWMDEMNNFFINKCIKDKRYEFLLSLALAKVAWKIGEIFYMSCNFEHLKITQDI